MCLWDFSIRTRTGKVHKHGLSSDSCKGAPHTLTGCWCRNERTGYTRSHGPVVDGPLKRTEKRNWRCTPAQGRYRKYKRIEERKTMMERRPRQVDDKPSEHYERTIRNTHEDQSRRTATSYKPRTARTQSDKDPQSTQSIVGHQPPKGPRRARGDTLPVRNKSIRTPLGQKRALFSKKSTFLHGPQTDTSTPMGYTEAGTGEMKKPTSTTSRLPGTPPLRKAK